MSEAIRAEFDTVRDLITSAERDCNAATEQAKVATGVVFRTMETLLASLEAVHEAEQKVISAQNNIIRAETNLAQAREEFEKLLERVRG